MTRLGIAPDWLVQGAYLDLLAVSPAGAAPTQFKFAEPDWKPVVTEEPKGEQAGAPAPAQPAGT